MKLTKKLLSVLLTLAMLAVMAVPAFAAGETGTITVKDAVNGQTYSIYQILEATVSNVNPDGAKDELNNPTTGNYSYKVTTEWGPFITNDETGGKYLEIDDAGNVTWKKDADVVEFVAEAKVYASSITATQSQKATEAGVVFESVPLGYYLLDSSVGTLCSVDTTNPNVTVKEKNEAPELVKKLVDEDGKEIDAATDIAGIGDVVNYKITVTVRKGAENYIVRDTMSAGLTLGKNISVKIGENDVPDGGYTITKGNGYTFTIEFDNGYIKELADNTNIVITYSATINKDAVETVNLDALTNVAKLVYGDNASVESTPSGTTTKTLKFTLKKVDADKAELKGAKFELYKESTGGTAINLFKINDNTYRLAETGETGTTTIEAGTVTIVGLDNITYWLEEKEAPAGYNKLTARERVDLSTVTEITNETNIVQEVINRSGTELPSTGGMGTTLFYLGGGAMFLGALVMLVTKKRMKD